MKNLKFKIVPNGTNINENVIATMTISESDFNLWYKENSRRLSEISRLEYSEIEWSSYREYIRLNPIFDVDESMGIGMMSQSHQMEMLKFLSVLLYEQIYSW